MNKFDTCILGGALGALTYTIGTVVVIRCAEKKAIKMKDTFYDKCRIMCRLIDEKFEKHEITEDKWIKLNDEVMDILEEYFKEFNKIINDDLTKGWVIKCNVKFIKDCTRITEEYTKMLDKVGMKLNGIDIFEPNKIIID